MYIDVVHGKNHKLKKTFQRQNTAYINGKMFFQDNLNF